MRTQLILLFALLVAASSPAFADPPASAGSTAVSAEVKAEAPTRFYGFGLDFSFWDGTNLNGPNYQNSFAFFFLPSWNFGKIAFPGTRFSTMSLSARFILNRELRGYDESGYSQFSDNGFAERCSNITPSTNGGVVDPTTINRCQYDSNFRWDQSDITLLLKNPKIITIPYALININPGLSLVLPTSAESQYATLRAAPGASLGATRSFLDGKLTIGYSFWFTKYFQQYTTPGVRTDGPQLQQQVVAAGYEYTDVESTTANFLADPAHVGTIGGYNPNYSFRHTFSVDINPIEKLSISALYILIDAFAYAAPCQTTINGVPYDLCNAGDAVAANSGSNILRVGHKDSQIFWLTVGYDVFDWLNVNIAWINSSPQRKPDGSLRQPFISTDYDAFTTINLGASISIEKAAAKLF